MTSPASGRYAGQLLTPDEHADNTKALSTIVELKLLDRYWTREAVRPATERADLTPVVDRMVELLRSVAVLAPKVAAVAAKYADQLQPSFDAGLRGRARLRDQFPDDAGDIARSSARLASEIVRMSDGEIDHLRSELRRINAELPSEGDLSVEFSVTLEAFGYTIEISGGADSSLVGGLLGLIFG